MLALLIPGKESVTTKNMDIYLAPSMEELLQLWEKVNVVDAFNKWLIAIFYFPSTTYVVYSQLSNIWISVGSSYKGI